MQYIIKNKINIKKIYIIAIFLFVFILPNISYADNLYGQTCGNTQCSQDEVCQKQYRGVLPIGNQNTGNATYTCVKPQNIEAPESPYKGDIGCGAGLGSGLTSGLGSIGSGFLNSVTGGILGSTLNTSLNNIAGDFLGNLTAPFGLKLDGTLTGILNDPIGAFTGDFTDLIGLDSILGDDCYYNNIDRVIDTRRLIAPLPVDLFNPLPLPVNVTSPTPLPVVVVDDLALYQQKELIDAPLAAQQKAKTIATVSDTLRYQISNDNLIPNNYWSLNQLGTKFGALDTKTGVLPQAVNLYGNYANFSLESNEALTKYFQDSQDPIKSKLRPETFSAQCGNIKPEEVSSLECAALLADGNNIHDISYEILTKAFQKSTEARNLLEQEVVYIGEGYFSNTANGDKNPFTKQIQTPGSNISSLSEKVTEATIDQAILASGDNCFEAIPKNILDGTLKPVLTQGLYGVDNTLASVLNNATNTTNKNIPGIGTVSIQSNRQTVTGISTKFTETFKIGDAIIINGETPKRITDINSDTLLTVSTPFSNTARTNVSYTFFRDFANQLQAGVNGSIPDPNRFFLSLQDSLVNNVTSSLSCELNKQISGLLNGIIGNVNLPGIGNVSNILTNTLTNTVNDVIRDGVNSITR